MKRNKSNFYKKGVNCNKPLKAARERTLYNSSLDKNVQKAQPSTEKPSKPPPELKGKALGLWYRDRNRQEELKPVTVTLDSSKQEDIENLLFKVGSSISSESPRKGAFQQRFLDKINVTFEEKLDQMKNVVFKPIKDLDEELYQEISKKKNHSNHFKKMLEFRQKLPSYKKRKEIIELIKENPIIVISGETGKTFLQFFIV